jgi:hypothetical protein
VVGGVDDLPISHHELYPAGVFAPVGRALALRQAAWIIRCLPQGLWAAAYAATGRVEGRRWLADWVWNMGWSVGKLRALAGRRAVAVRAPPAYGAGGTEA